MAYASDESGRDEVYVRSFPLTPEGTRWPVSTDGGTGPRWAHDGEELFFIRRGELIAVEIRPGSTFQTGAERPLFSGAVFGGTLGGFDVARDGRFLMMRPIGGVVSDHETVVVAEKVIEELKARTGR